jgi:hypothetical protein
MACCLHPPMTDSHTRRNRFTGSGQSRMTLGHDVGRQARLGPLEPVIEGRIAPDALESLATPRDGSEVSLGGWLPAWATSTRTR